MATGTGPHCPLGPGRMWYCWIYLRRWGKKGKYPPKYLQGQLCVTAGRSGGHREGQESSPALKGPTHPKSLKSQHSVICLIPRANGLRKFGQNRANCPKMVLREQPPGQALLWEQEGGREAELSWQEAAGAGAAPGHQDKGQDNPRGSTR